MLENAFSESDLEVLRSELRDKVADLEGLFLNLEQEYREDRSTLETVHLILRIAHSLKGSLGMVAQPQASDCMHSLETVFVAIREGKLFPMQKVFDLALASLDQLSRFAEQGEANESVFADLAQSWQRLEAKAEGKMVTGYTCLPFPLSTNEAEILRKAIRSGKHLFLIEKAIVSNLTKADYEGLPIYEDIASLGTLVARRPSFEDINRKQGERVLLLLIATSWSAPEMANQIFDPLSQVWLSKENRHTYRTDSQNPTLSCKAISSPIKTLVVEDDFTSRLLLQKIMSPLGEAHVAVDGKEALEAIKVALDTQEPYQLIFLDIMMPNLDGQGALRGLRQLEETKGITLGNGAKVIMTTCLADNGHVMAAFREQCDAYLVKPIDRANLLQQLQRLELLVG